MKFGKYYNLLVIILEGFFFYIFILIILANLGYFQNINYLLVPAIALLFYFLGVVIGNAKRNWFVGIRTPWTLSSDEVWDKTHKLGDLLFKISSAIIIIGMFFERYLIWFILIPVFLTAIVLVVYSYVEFGKLKIKMAKEKKESDLAGLWIPAGIFIWMGAGFLIGKLFAVLFTGEELRFAVVSIIWLTKI